MKARVARCLVCVGVAFGVDATRARAQGHGGVAESGMAQGEAQVSTRSDVRMSVENGPGTSAARLGPLAGALAGAMAEIRRCYQQTLADRPTVTGRMRLRVELPAERGPLRVALADDGTGDASLGRCVGRALGAVPVRDLERPAVAFVVLDFDNTAAASAAVHAERVAAASVVALQRDEQGRPFTEVSLPGREIVIRMHAEGTTPEQALVQLTRDVRAAIPGLLDCRRRAGRRGASPAGDLVVDLAVAARGRPRVRVGSSSVADPRAPTCVSRALTSARFSPESAGRARLSMRWN
ncbi:MAG: hypothetical protein NZ898_15140 [Myxococcota bacterium]|nr:hypothetical protein [Myxococcota bacterium]MDW8363159.1 hypothetical protein [Myxococcales bacterium]